jgi:predicted TPR repeat methyltransferase
VSGADPYARLAGVYDEIVVDPCHGRWAAFLHELWGADGAGVRTVLDICCGTGLMASELIALGYRVVGVDASAAMLARARRLLGPDVVLLRETLPDLTIDAVFDAAVSTFDGLNYLTLAELRETLVALEDRIRPGGWFVFDVHTDAMMEFTAANPVVEGEADGQRFAIASAVDVRARTCDSRIEVTRDSDGGAFTERHRQYFFTEGQINGALTAAGFEVLAVTNEYTHEPVDGSTLRATWTARRRPPSPP